MQAVKYGSLSIAMTCLLGSFGVRDLQPYTSRKEPCISAKEPYTSTKSPIYEPKDPEKSPIHPEKSPVCPQKSPIYEPKDQQKSPVYKLEETHMNESLCVRERNTNESRRTGFKINGLTVCERERHE